VARATGVEVRPAQRALTHRARRAFSLLTVDHGKDSGIAAFHGQGDPRPLPQLLSREQIDDGP
jgi:hypothetical protein